ncbi:MAG: glycine--tRNA ligase [bacterium]|nr:glycine--tRNA ligase [bacterium]
MKDIVSLAKRRGFIFPSSEIYGGVEALWDYGPLGAATKQNIKDAWISRFVREQDSMVLIDAAIIMHPAVWKASGHLENFTDPLIECKTCNARFRADHMMDGRFVGQGEAKEKNQCPNCGDRDFTQPKDFNLMFKTFLGPVEDSANTAYLRPETAQAMFTDFKLVQESMRLKLPFGIAQIGKSFRNEITTGNFTFRSREFEIAEAEFFVRPGEDEKWFEYWLDQWEKFFVDMGLNPKKLRRYEHPKNSLAHYSKRTVDIEYEFPFGWSELGGVANRTDFDLRQHEKASGKDLSYLDEESGKKIIPYVIEPTLGIERLLLALLLDSYRVVKGGRSTTTKSVKEEEVMLDLRPQIAPVKVAVFPLLRNKPELVSKAREIFEELRKHFACQYDETGAVGRRYRRQDEIGTPFAVTVDFETLEQGSVTLRDRNTMEQERVQITQLKDVISKRLKA